MRVFVVGYPGDVGGANTECWHTVKLWRGAGIDVDMIPTWGPGDPKYRAKLDALGCTTHNVPEIPGGIGSVPGLAGSPVVGFCNQHFLGDVYRVLKQIGCRTIWANCMTFWFPAEKETWQKYGMPDHLIFQSQYQRERLEATMFDAPKKTCCGETPAIAPLYDPKSSHIIRGAFDLDEWTFDPNSRTETDPFVLGKLARADLDKWSSNLWPIYGRVQHPNRKALVMGVGPEVEKKLGPTPAWAEWKRPNSMPAREYYRSIHCLLTVNGGAAENWPRIGLEAMAAGVPIVAQRQWGWLEQIKHGETGYLGGCDEELAHWAGVLAWNERHRQEMAHAAREHVAKLTEPSTLWESWRRVFEGMPA